MNVRGAVEKRDQVVDVERAKPSMLQLVQQAMERQTGVLGIKASPGPVRCWETLEGLDLDAHLPAVNKTGKGVELVCSCGEDLGCVPNDVDVVLDLLDLWGGHANELGYKLGKRVKAAEIRQALKEEL